MRRPRLSCVLRTADSGWQLAGSFSVHAQRRLLREGVGLCCHGLPPNHANFRWHRFSSLVQQPGRIGRTACLQHVLLKADALFCYSLGKVQLLAFSG